MPDPMYMPRRSPTNVRGAGDLFDSKAVPSFETVKCLAKRALPHHRIVDVRPLPGGLSNSNFKLQTEPCIEPVVLRIYERDPAACRKEIDVLRIVRDTVPTPEVLHAEPAGSDTAYSFALLRYMDGVTFHQLMVDGDREAIAQASYSIGKTLAAIGHHTFPQPGQLGAGPAVTGQIVEGPDPLPRFIDTCLASPRLSQLVRGRLKDEVRALAWTWAPRLADFNGESHLVHCDYSPRNLPVSLVRGRWEVSAVIDWEFAISGTPLFDLGNFLRYERAQRPLREPHFSVGYAHGGGHLPEDWRQLARIVDLASLCEMLTRKGLPDSVVSEVYNLIRATVTTRDLRLQKG